MKELKATELAQMKELSTRALENVAGGYDEDACIADKWTGAVWGAFGGTVFGGVVGDVPGATGGFFVGGYAGYFIEDFFSPNCN